MKQINQPLKSTFVMGSPTGDTKYLRVMDEL